MDAATPTFGLGRGTGRMLDKRGYILAMSKGHPRANRDGYVWEHILVAERALGHHLSPPCVVHHFDETHDNNEPANLVICPDQGYHKLLHQRADALKACGDANALKCDVCGSYDRQAEIREYVTRGVGRCGRHLSCNRAHVRLSTKAKKRPLAIDLFCGLSGWGEGLIAEGFDVVGYDIEDMFKAFGQPKPEHFQLVIRDVSTLRGSRFKNADLIVASPPCQAYSWRAMPWKAAKAAPPPDNSLFDACFRIQREACAAAGHHIPLVVENVRGAQKWVGRARWNFGSFYLWGDVPALMPMIKPRAKSPGLDWNGFKNGDPNYKGQAFNPAAQGKALRERLEIKNTGGSWFNIAHNTTSGKGQNPDGRLLRKDGKPHMHQLLESREGAKSVGSGPAWWRQGPGGLPSKSSARKFASAMIAKIPLTLSRHIAATFRPAAEQSRAAREQRA